MNRLTGGQARGLRALRPKTYALAAAIKEVITDLEGADPKHREAGSMDCPVCKLYGVLIGIEQDVIDFNKDFDWHLTKGPDPSKPDA